MSAYEVLKYRPEHKARIAELQCDLWSSDPALNAAILEWRYERNPYLDDIPIYLATSHGRIVAMRGFYGGRWEAGIPRQENLVYCADDLVIAPEHRNRGVFTLIMKAAFDDLQASGDGIVLTLSGGMTTVLGSLAMGWKSIGQTLPTRLLSNRTRLLQLIRSYGAEVPVARQAVRWLPDRGRPERFTRLDSVGATRPSGGRVWLAREPQAQAMAELIERLGTDGRIRHVRDAKYFAWRFANPMNEYRFLYAGADRLTGYLVLRRCISDRFDTSAVYVSDWEGENVAIKRDLLRAAIDWGGFSELMAWTATAARETVQILLEAGFPEAVRSPRGIPCILVKPYGTTASAGTWTMAGKSVLDPSNWDLRMLYSMQG
jgi:GNAT superfamily N-acetyltransferase